jgi:hypothetical protein
MENILGTLNENDFRVSLSDVIRPQDECVWISSGVWTFAHHFGWPRDEIADRLLDIVLDVIGPERTLLLPSYTFAYAKNRQYDIRLTPPETGVLPKTALRRDGFLRTLKPINSYLVFGPRANEVLALPCATAWGSDSVMEWVENNDVRLCVLGVPWHEACSFYHRAEQIANVPYRYYKRFPGALLRDGEVIGQCEETMFVTSLVCRPAIDWARIHVRTLAVGEVLVGRYPVIFVESVTAKVVQEAGLSILQENPYGLVKNANEVREWVANDRLNEIRALPPGDQSPFNS